MGSREPERARITDTQQLIEAGQKKDATGRRMTGKRTTGKGGVRRNSCGEKRRRMGFLSHDRRSRGRRSGTGARHDTAHTRHGSAGTQGSRTGGRIEGERKWNTDHVDQIATHMEPQTREFN